MTDYISRDAALNFDMSINADPDKIQAITEGMALYAEYLKQIPAEDVKPVIKAEWIEDGYYNEPCVCSYCGEPCKDTVMGRPRWIFCPHCGAEIKTDDN